jgi:hypothetical protein
MIHLGGQHGSQLADRVLKYARIEDVQQYQERDGGERELVDRCPNDEELCHADFARTKQLASPLKLSQSFGRLINRQVDIGLRCSGTAAPRRLHDHLVPSQVRIFFITQTLIPWPKSERDGEIGALLDNAK